MQADHALSVLKCWQDAGYLRPIDRVFAGFLHRQDGETNGLVLLAAALASYYYGEGHIALNLAAVSAHPAHALKPPRQTDVLLEEQQLPGIVLAGISLQQWRDALRQSGLVECYGMQNHPVASVATNQGKGGHERGEPLINLPLVFESDHVYLTRNWLNEYRVAATIHKRAAASADADQAVNFSASLAKLFPGTLDPVKPNWQKIACVLATRGRILIITGGPGTGKTYTVVRLLALLQSHPSSQANQPLRIMLAAPTGKAAARLTESIADAMSSLPETMRQHIPTKAATLHQLLGASRHGHRYRHHQDNPIQADVVVIDEASMIDLDMMAALLRALPESTRLVLVGDKDQLASVEAGSVMGDLCHALDQRGYNPATVDWIQATTGETVTNDQAKTIDPLAQQTVMLRDSKRFRVHSGIGQMALAINGGDIRKVKAVLTGTGRGDLHWRQTSLPDSPFIHRIVVGEKGPIKAEQGFRHYLHVIQSAKPTASPTEANIADWCEQVLRAFASFQVLCAVREGEWGVNRINQRIADVLHRERLIARADGWYEGRPVMMTRNDYELGIMNGDVGIALSLPSAQGAATLKVVFRNADGSLKMLHPSRLSTVETVYAMTVHKSQGSEFGHVVFILPDSPNNPVATRELLYTGVTRARNQLTLVASQENDIILMVEKRIQRSGRLGERLQ